MKWATVFNNLKVVIKSDSFCNFCMPQWCFLNNFFLYKKVLINLLRYKEKWHFSGLRVKKIKIDTLIKQIFSIYNLGIGEIFIDGHKVFIFGVVLHDWESWVNHQVVALLFGPDRPFWNSLHRNSIWISFAKI